MNPNLESNLSSMAELPIKLVTVAETDVTYAIGEELAVRRVAHKLKTFEIGCSSWMNLHHGQSWWVQIPESLL